MSKAISLIDEVNEYKAKATAYEARIAVLESQNEELMKIIGGNKQ